MSAPPNNSDSTRSESTLPSGLKMLSRLATRKDLADLLGVRSQTLNWMTSRRGQDSYYRTWTITKKTGGARDITAPRSTLYRAQKTLSVILQDAYNPRHSVHGFVGKRSVVTNADGHVGRRFVLNVDLEDFFPSIHFGRVRGLFAALPFELSPEVAKALAQLCSYDGSLPIGAPTSPVLSNMICLRMDSQLQRLARQKGCWYTRYADDLTFSSSRREFPREIAHRNENGTTSLGNDLERIVETNGFKPNITKTRLQSAGDRQVVTGIIVNRKLNLDRRYIRRIRAMLHSWDKYGLDGAQGSVSRWDKKERFPGAEPDFKRMLWGRISYLVMVRGENDPLAKRFEVQYTNLSLGQPLGQGLDSPANGATETTLLTLTSPSPLPPDLLMRWVDREDDVAARVTWAAKMYGEAQNRDDLRRAVRELADALERLRPRIRQALHAKEHGALFQIANKFGIRHLDEKQILDYDEEYLIWIFWSYLNTINLIDSLIEKEQGS